MFEHLNVRVNFNRADYSNLNFSKEDRSILKGLAEEVAEIAAREEMKEKKDLWEKHNALEDTRPLIFCDPENGWNEIITDDKIKCKNDIAKHWEVHLRKLIFWGNEMHDDYVVEPYFDVPYVYTETEWNTKGNDSIKKTFGEENKGKKSYKDDGGAFKIESILDSYDDLDQIIKPEINIDYEKTEKVLTIANEIFDGILDVRNRTVWFWSIGLTDEFAFLRGMENLMFDFYDHPEGVHKVMEILLEGTMEKLDYLEENNLLALNNDKTFVGSGGIGYTNELPQDDYTGKVRTQDMWGLAESQITVGVSPQMFEEFIFPYQKKLMERFGLSCYGCCEPMDDRFDIVKEVENLRRISVSPWADKKVMAEKLGPNYIYSLKPSPSPLATTEMNEAIVREEIKEALALAKEFDLRLEMIMKDNHTIGNNPENVKRWVEIAREEVNKLY